MAWVDPKIAEKVAHLPEIHAAVLLERDQLERIAAGIFSSHDNPGGHKITTTTDELDGLVNLDGPAPLSVEYGHWSETKDGRKHVEGLHVFGRAIAQATL